VLEAIAGPVTRIVSLTVTEKGYLRDPASGDLQTAHPDIVHDLENPDAPRTALGFIVHGLARRRQRGLGPLTLLSLDNLPANGHSLRRLVAAFARRVDQALADWILDGCTFPNSMVDRIVPRTTASDRDAVGAALGLYDASPVITEPFFDWVVEDRFAAGRPTWEAAGVRFVPEAAPWEQLKLRMVNGSHSAIAYLGAMAGWPTVDRAIAQPSLMRFVQALMEREIEPALPPLPGLDLQTYRTRLLQRFSNPALAHRTQQIAMDGSQKLPQRLLCTARDRLAGGVGLPLVALAIAAWLHYLRGHDEQGQAYPVDDPLAEELHALRDHADAQTDDMERARAYTRFTPVFGDLSGHPALVAALAPALASLRSRGVEATLSQAVPA
jgi:fructuronate reductase